MYDSSGLFFDQYEECQSEVTVTLLLLFILLFKLHKQEKKEFMKIDELHVAKYHLWEVKLSIYSI